MKPASDLLFASIDIPILNKEQATKEILALPSQVSWWDSYRYTKMIPLSTRGGSTGQEGTSNFREGEFQWVNYAPKVITEWFDNIVFPFIGMKARVMALITEPGVSNYEHIDCQPRELNTLQHKLRIVLQGKTSTLYFITEQGNIHVPDVYGAFLMDGGWVHGMTNDTDQVKVTLALGAPWIGNDEYNNVTTLLKRSDYTMPSDLTDYWMKPKEYDHVKQRSY